MCLTCSVNLRDLLSTLPTDLDPRGTPHAKSGLSFDEYMRVFESRVAYLLGKDGD